MMSKVIKIDQAVIDATIQEAKLSERKRKNFNFHTLLSDPINRMLNAMEPGTYAAPHKHENPDKREVFIILTGKIVVVIFDEEGAIIDHIILHSSEGKFGIEIPSGVWHTVISLETGSVVYEVKDGPYNQSDDKNFASWAPQEGDEECTQYIAQTLKKLGIDF